MPAIGPVSGHGWGLNGSAGLLSVDLSSLSCREAGCEVRTMPDFRNAQPGWYCFQAIPKKEHLAARLLSVEPGLSAFCPRIAFYRKTRRGRVRFVECLFPGYLFVHGDMRVSYRLVRSTAGVREVVCFGDRVPVLPEAFIEELRSRVGPEEIALPVPEPVLRAGMEVTITEGPFRDWNAVVEGEVDARQRVALLLDFLGRRMEVRLPVSDLMAREAQPRRDLLSD